MRTLALSTVVVALALLTNVQLVAAQSSDEAAVAQAVEAYRKAMLAADRSQLEAICADQLSYGHSAGRIETKAQFIDGAVSGRSTWKFITLTDHSNQIVGNNAIVRHIFTGENESAGKTNAIKIGILMVWQKQDGRWKLLARQAYKI
jgi:ketosteroid isomerase-like protein